MNAKEALEKDLEEKGKFINQNERQEIFLRGDRCPRGLIKLIKKDNCEKYCKYFDDCSLWRYKNEK